MAGASEKGPDQTPRTAPERESNGAGARGAREDLGRAVEADPEDRGYAFEKLMLDTVESGIGACVEQWIQLLASPVSTL
ncbi:hypothetical protein ACFRFL_44015, partial [Streptomyces sp. NPDC056708]